MQQCWHDNLDERCRFSELHQKLATILGFYIQTRSSEASDQRIPEVTERNGGHNQASMDNRDSYLHPVEEVNEGFVMEMKEL